MMKFATRGALSALLAIVLASGAHGQQISPQLAQKAPEAATIAAVAEQNGFVRVIVEFAGPVPPGQLRPDPALLADVRTRIAAVQDTIIASHFGSASNPTPGPGFPRAILRFDITPGFAVNVTQAELDSLAANPQVVRINYDRLEAPVLLQSVPLVGMPNSYASGATGLGQAVAVIDTGVQSNHVLLSGKVVMEQCFSNSGGTGVTLCPNSLTSQSGAGAADPDTPQCLNGGTNLCRHGTHVAGIAAGNNTSASDVAGGAPANGVAKSAKLVAVQVFTRFNDATSCNPSPPPCVLSFTSDMVSALNFLFTSALTPAVGVKLASANMSIGGGLFPGTCDGDARKAPIDNLKGAGVATAIAAGNNGNTSNISAPGCISTAVTVGSSDKNDIISGFSNMSSVVDLMAPGGFGGGACAFGANNADILSSVAVSPPATNFYACLAGTSMATPHVAGAFAAIRSACPNATVDQITTALQNTGLSITDTRVGGTQTKPRIRVALAVQQLGCSNGPRTATHEFNNDSKSDILWYNTTTGQLVNWLISGTSVIGGGLLGTVPSPPWGIVGQRDFNGDGRSDFLWRNSTTGQLLIWLVNGGSVIGGGSPGSAASPWAVLGTGDFNGDGFGDVLWYNTSTGQVVIWLLNGSLSVIGGGSPGSAAGWTVAGTGDFNGDGKWDILWRNNTTGQVVIWFLNGASVIGGGSPGGAASPWTIAGTGDFNGDGFRDILWYNTTTGQALIWLLNGTTVIGGGSPGTVGSPWTIVDTGDFNGDGMSDIFWYNTSSGQVVLWLVNGTSVIGGGSPGSAASPWQPQGQSVD
jgi:hypothetical protein